MTFLNKLNSAHMGKICGCWHLVIGVTSTNNISLSLCCRVVKKCEDET